jgi:membrane-bound lytic murein transglycosylase B
LAGTALLLAGCQHQPEPIVPAPPPPVAVQPPAPTVEDKSFALWLAGAKAEALRRGIRAETVAAAMDGLEPIPRVIELDHGQPEFTQTFSRYISNAVTQARVNEGRALMEKNAALLSTVEREYAVPGRFLIAFWGMESAYGHFPGNFPVVGALATLAWDGRRGAMFREEMFNALTILDRGHITVDRMKGSWAGAMGNTQFMPSTFLRNAVDEDKDGKIDIWGDIADTLGSTANYLKNLGWNPAHTWGREVILPAGFDAGLASLDSGARETIKSLREWRALGIRAPGGAALPDADIPAALLIPGGIRGPAFLVYDNFRTIMRFNNSIYYALAVGHLSDRIAGAPALSMPKQMDPALKRDEVVALQSGLITLGLLKGEADGVIGSGTRQAVRLFQRAHGLPPDGYADATLIAQVKYYSGGNAA